MNINSFIIKYGKNSRPIKEIIHHWVLEKEVDDFLGTTIMGGMLIADVMIGDGLLDTVSPEVREGFTKLMGEKTDTYYEIKKIILEKAKKGDASVRGLISKIQSQIGENEFVRQTGGVARLAESGSQKGWDISINRPEGTEYVQVKIYKDPNDVIKVIQEVNKQTLEGEIIGIGEPVNSVNFAVNSDIFIRVNDKVEELGLENRIYEIKATREEILGLLDDTNINVIEPFENFFDELFDGVIKGAALHLAVNAFLVWKGAKEKADAIEDTIHSTAITTGGLSAAYLTEVFTEEVIAGAFLLAELEAVATILSGPVGAIFAIPAGMGVRAILKRISDRRFIVQRFREENKKLSDLCTTLARLPQFEK